MQISIWTLIGQALTLLLFLTIYALPSIIALARNHPKRWSIIAVNLIGGLLVGIGWIVAMIWCFVDDAGVGTSRIDELERLDRLKQGGSLTEAEFEHQKRALLQARE
ncbi:MAG: superinfection immunity protein [Wenzhouxiangella sp.]|nr:superinfection immunity protein [Wenzhouxiangella sp.]